MQRATTLAGLCLAALFGLSDTVTGQQLFRRSQYFLNPYLSNPAVAGTSVDSPVFATVRNQWAGFTGAPRTQVLSGHTSLPGRLGLGGIVFNDNTGGAYRQAGAELTAAYAIDLNNYDAVSFGLGISTNQWSFDPRGLEVWDVDDPTLQMAEQKVAVDANFGLMVYGQNYSFGFAIPQLFQASTGLSSSRLSSTGPENELTRHLNFMGTYAYEVKRGMVLEGSGFIRMTGESPAQFDGYLRGVYQNKVWACAGFRLNEAALVGLGARYANTVFGYTYEVGFGDVRYFSPHTHELSVGYQFMKQRGFKGGIGSGRTFDRRRLVKIPN